MVGSEFGPKTVDEESSDSGEDHVNGGSGSSAYGKAGASDRDGARSANGSGKGTSAGFGAGSSSASGSAHGNGARVIKTVRFRRGRAAKACEVCHARKVRCDMTEKFPCTNCRAFALVCVPRTGRTKGKSEFRAQETDPVELDTASAAAMAGPSSSAGSATSAGTSSALQDETLSAVAMTQDGTSRAISMDKSHAQIESSLQKREPSRFMGTLRDSLSTGGELPEDGLLAQILKTRFKVIALPHYDADVVAARATGCFLLPSPELSDHLVDRYFHFVHPVVPVVNRLEFLQQYREDRDKPPLLLRHAMFCVATKLSTHPDLLDEHGSARKAAYAFYRRAKMLIDIGFEENVETCISAAIILSLAIENPLFMNQNGYYWVRVAQAQAQGVRMHRRLRGHESTPEKRRRYRRIWWALYKRDVATAVAFGAPLAINLDDCDVEMVKPEDFADSEGTDIKPGSDTDVHINYFIQSVRLHEILALIIRVQLSVGAERLRRQHVLPDITQCDRALAEWVNQLPEVLTYSIKDQRRHHFVRALLYLEYYTVVCLSHRPQVSHLFKLNGWEDFPAWSIAFQGAHMICKILENFGSHGELRSLPGYSVYSCFTALVMMSFQRRVLRDRNDAVSLAVEQGLKSFVDICREMGKTHATGIWVMQLAIDLQSDEVASKIAKSLRQGSNKRRRQEAAPSRSQNSGIVLATDPADSGYDSSSPLSQISQVSPTAAYTPTTPSANTQPLNAVPRLPGSRAGQAAPAAQGPEPEGVVGGVGEFPARPSFVPDEDVADPVKDEPLTDMSPIKRSDSVAAIDFFPQEPVSGDFFVDPKTALSLSSGSEEIPDSITMVDWYDFLSTGPGLDSTMGPML